MMYLLAAFLCAYAGFAALCAITTRNVPLVWTTPPSRPLVQTLRVTGFLLLTAAWLPCYWNWDIPMGTVAWVMTLSVSSLALVFPFAYAPRRSMQAGGVAVVLALLVLLAR